MRGGILPSIDFSDLLFYQIFDDRKRAKDFLEPSWSSILLKPDEKSGTEEPPFKLPDTQGSCVCLLVGNRDTWPELLAPAFLSAGWPLAGFRLR